MSSSLQVLKPDNSNLLLNKIKEYIFLTLITIDLKIQGSTQILQYPTTLHKKSNKKIRVIKQATWRGFHSSSVGTINRKSWNLYQAVQICLEWNQLKLPWVKRSPTRCTTMKLWNNQNNSTSPSIPKKNLKLLRIKIHSQYYKIKLLRSKAQFLLTTSRPKSLTRIIMKQICKRK